jgi:quercetin 2,3-dioxygenase
VGCAPKSHVLLKVQTGHYGGGTGIVLEESANHERAESDFNPNNIDDSVDLTCELCFLSLCHNWKCPSHPCGTIEMRLESSTHISPDGINVSHRHLSVHLMSSKESHHNSTSVKTSSYLSYKTLAVLIALLAITLASFSPLRSTLSRTLSKITSAPLTSTKRAMATTTATTTASNGTAANLKITKRPWDARGHADHGWLYTYHTFSFASYFDPKNAEFGPLRVINEDRVEKGTGFGTHSHAEFLIWSYIVSGELEHKDSMGNLEKLRRGEVQFTSAGTGIRHSEYNRNKEEDVHFLQIWAKPDVRGLKPSYKTRKFTDEMKQDKLLRIMESVKRHSGKDEETEPIPMHADLSMDASILAPGKSVTHELVAEGERKVYLHVVMSGRTQPKSGGARIRVGDVELGEGDGAYVEKAKGPGSVTVESIGEEKAEFLLFDMGL